MDETSGDKTSGPSRSPPATATGSRGLEPTLPSPSTQPSPAASAMRSVPEGQRYAVEGLFAEGGIGRILRARDERLGRWVALKVLREPGSSAEGRFLTEALVTARLQHPSIVPVYDTGRLSNGEPFYAMKLVSGRPLSERMAEAGTLSQRLALLPHMLAVADAVAYAHGQRILHRDLKPANVLVGDFGETVVIDWGLAKELGEPQAPAASALATAPEELEVSSSATMTGLVLGTPAYMPPEQALGAPVDERADVYALGVMLYQLLCGSLPYGDGDSVRVLRKLLAGPPPALERRQPGVPEELQAIVGKAMAREPAERYPSARELAEDLRRFLTGQLVEAYRYSRLALVRRFVRRYRAVLAVAAVALAVVAVQATLGVRRILSERDRAEQAHLEATRRADALTLVVARAAAHSTPYEALECLGEISDRFAHWGAVRTIASHALAQGLPLRLLGHSQTINAALFSPDGRRLATLSDDKTVRLWNASTGQLERVLGPQQDEVWSGAWSPGGQQLVTTGKDGKAWVWDLNTGRAQVLEGLQELNNHSLVSQDARYAFAFSLAGTVLRWEVASGQSATLGRWLPPTDPSASADGRLLAMIGPEREVEVWDVEAARVLARRKLPGVASALALSAQGTLLAVGTKQGEVWLEDRVAGTRTALELPSEECRLPGSDAIRAMAFSADGRLLTASTLAGAVWVWDVSTHRLRHRLQGALSSNVPFSLHFSRDGRWLATPGDPNLVLLWNLESGQRRELRGARDRILSTAFSPDGRRLVAVGADGVVRSFQLEHQLSRVLQRHQRAVSSLAVQGASVASAGLDGTLQHWSLEGTPLARPESLTGPVHQIQLLPGGQALATARGDGTVHLRSASHQVSRTWPGHVGSVLNLEPSPDGRWLASGGRDGAVRMWAVDSGEGRLLGLVAGGVTSLAFSAEGRWLAAGGEQGHVWLWELTSGRPGRLLHTSRGPVRGLTFSPDGRRLAAGSHDHTLWVKELEREAQEALSIDVPGGGVSQVAFGPEGHSVLTVSYMENVVRRWDVRTGAELPRLQGHTAPVRRFALSPERRRLATASFDSTVRLWDLESGESRELRGHQGAVYHVAFSEDGRHVLSAGEDGTVRRWEDSLPLEPHALRAWLHKAAGAASGCSLLEPQTPG